MEEQPSWNDATRAMFRKFKAQHDELQRQYNIAYDRIQEQRSTIDRLNQSLTSIERDARLKSDPGRAHSCQMSYGELLSGYRTIAAMARLARIKANTD